MKKSIAVLLVVALLASSVGTYAAERTRGGFMGFIAGCCFGIRAAAAYNDGKDIHWREWIHMIGVIPYVGLVAIIFNIWDGIDGANGVTTAEYAQRYGAMYY
ncbi:MAG: hypothetical protein JXB04_04745 [Kiritimatiellae bacterium]|nr:hypothetical protein [Kiritimatiellia bacterium]